MALEAARDGSEPLDKYRFRSPEAVERARSDDPRIRRSLRDYEQRKPDKRTGTFTRDETRGRLVAWHWELVKHGVFGGKHAAQIVHSYMSYNPMSAMPHDLARRDKWRPPVPGIKAIASATCMEIRNVRRCMRVLADLGLIDITDSYDHPRLLSFDEDSDYDRRQELARLRGWPQPSGKRTVQITGATDKHTQVIQEDPVLRTA